MQEKKLGSGQKPSAIKFANFLKNILHKYTERCILVFDIFKEGQIMSVKVGIVGVTGYTGGELIRLLLNHPEAEVVAASSRSNVGNPVSAVHRQLFEYMNLVECEIKAENYAACDVVFFSAAPWGVFWYGQRIDWYGQKVIDLGADFRLRDYDAYQQWYGAEHAWPEVLPTTVYGLPELYRGTN